MRALYLAPLLCVVGGCFFGGHAPEGTGDSASSSEREVAHIAEQTDLLLARLTARGAFLDNPTIAAISASIIEKLPLNHKGAKPQVRLLRNPGVNALVLNDGTICIYSGLVAKLTHRDQLAFVIAHEAAHWSLEHSLKRFQSTSKALLLAQIVDSVVPPVAARFRLGGVAEEWIDWASIASVNVYSRELEIEADIAGVSALREAGYDPRRAIDVLRIFARRGSTPSLSGDSSLLSDHPSGESRIEELTNFLAERYGQPTDESVATDNEFIRATADIRIANARWALRAGVFLDAREDLGVVERAFAGVTPTSTWYDTQFEIGETYRAMVRDITFVKRSLSTEYWQRLYGDATDEAVLAQWRTAAVEAYTRARGSAPLATIAQDRIEQVQRG